MRGRFGGRCNWCACVSRLIILIREGIVVLRVISGFRLISPLLFVCRLRCRRRVVSFEGLVVGVWFMCGTE